jgi:hypothetical protein
MRPASVTQKFSYDLERLSAGIARTRSRALAEAAALHEFHQSLIMVVTIGHAQAILNLNDPILFIDLANESPWGSVCLLDVDNRVHTASGADVATLRHKILQSRRVKIHDYHNRLCRIKELYSDDVDTDVDNAGS